MQGNIIPWLTAFHKTGRSACPYCHKNNIFKFNFNLIFKKNCQNKKSQTNDDLQMVIQNVQRLNIRIYISMLLLY